MRGSMLLSQQLFGPILLHGCCHPGETMVANDVPNNISRLSNMLVYLLGLLSALRSPVESDWAVPSSSFCASPFSRLPYL
ncbi:hypothetical protein DENSPDRAFT_840805 [Dentipellis sp. KUC8613]|nr:hypothetical protein DENSPDRAFT_840805 [Dentipellis sp. KUC8613]